ALERPSSSEAADWAAPDVCAGLPGAGAPLGPSLHRAHRETTMIVTMTAQAEAPDGARRALRPGSSASTGSSSTALV
ncbi:hypothetical protein HMPREF9005_2246, partial [Actinomyces sp. oral taxon 178 str. F0338]